MNKKNPFAFVLLLVVSLACSMLTTPVSQTITPKKCSPQNWDVPITSVKENDLGDGTKDVMVNLGIENNDQLWGAVSGPYSVNNPKPVILTTTSGKEYEYTTKNIPFSLPNGDVIYIGSGFIKTPEIAPGFSLLGQSYSTISVPYTFVFNIPSTEVPATFTIDTLQINCPGDYIMVDGAPVWGGGLIYVAPRTYSLGTDIKQVQTEPSVNNYPSLKGSRIVREDNQGEYSFTDVTRKGDTITVTFDYFNPSTYSQRPSFSGYIIGDKKVYTCLQLDESECDMEQTFDSGDVQPGQTVKNITGIFTVPEDENNLVFAFVPSDNLNAHTSSIYNLNP